MKAPPRLQALITEGVIDSVVRQLKSGKEADVYVVRCGDETCAAKVYKEAHKRSFRQAVDYTENRKVRNSRQARAMAKGGQLAPDVPLTGRYEQRPGAVDLSAVLREIEDARLEEAARVQRFNG